MHQERTVNCQFVVLCKLLKKICFVVIDEESLSIIPGMGPEDKVDMPVTPDGEMAIPGLDLDMFAPGLDDKGKAKKVPYSKPIPRNFQAQWNETAGSGKLKSGKKRKKENDVISFKLFVTELLKVTFYFTS